MLIKHGTPTESKLVEKEEAPEWTKNFKKLQEDKKEEAVEDTEEQDD